MSVLNLVLILKLGNSSHGKRDHLASIFQAEVKETEPQLVVAGMEPLEFTNLFPTWTPRPDVTAIQERVSAVLQYVVYFCMCQYTGFLIFVLSYLYFTSLNGINAITKQSK